MRNAWREMLRMYGLPSNRQRMSNENQLAVRFEDYPDPTRWVDDFAFGYFVADQKQIPADVVKARSFQFKRDSIVRGNLALAVEPYRDDALLTQSPLTVKESPWRNAPTSALLKREVVTTAYQYPIALNLGDLGLDDPVHGVQYRSWFRYLLRGLSELNDVAGNHARSYFEMAPASLVMRLSDSLVFGLDLYCFNQAGAVPEVQDAILSDDYPGSEFILAGHLVRDVLTAEERAQLAAKGTRLYRRPHQALDAVARQLTGDGFLEVASEPVA
jgi:CRISPR-associated protein Cst2